MNDEKRLQLQKGDKIRLFRSRDSSDVWEITDIAGEGGSAVCYEASCSGKNGRLKEFNPVYHKKGIPMKRTASNQLVPVHFLQQNRFSDLCSAFTEAYLKLERAKKADKDNEVLNNFIPPYEILYGLNEDGVRGSVYIWTPDDKQGIGFDTYLAEVRKNPDGFGWKKLYEIICILYTLTDCVRALHGAGFLHLDLKPSNFLIPFTGGRELNTRTISLFDVNTLYDIDSSIPMIAGSKGIQAPEVRKGRADNRSDIYSIGGMLYQALVFRKVPYTTDNLYLDDYYYEILDYLICRSTLLHDSEVAGDRYVRYWLMTILQKSLAKNPDSRYGACEELMEDLEGLRTFLEYTMTKKSLEALREEEDEPAEIEQKRGLLYSTEIKVPFTPCLEFYEMIERVQNCSVGIDISHESVQVAVGKETGWFLLPLGDDGATELSVTGHIPPDTARSSAFFHDVFSRIRSSGLDEWSGGAEKITAVLSLPCDIDAEEIDVICRIAAAHDIYIRRVIDRTAALAAAAWKVSSDRRKDIKDLKDVYHRVLACLFDGELFQVATFEGWMDLDPTTRKIRFNLKEREIRSVRGIEAETCLDVLQDMIYFTDYCRPSETAVVRKAFGKGNEEIIKQAKEKGLCLFPECHDLQPCYGAMLLNEMMQMFQSEILQVDTAPPFDIHFQINGQERKWIVGKGHGLLHQCEKISFYLPPSEEFIEVRILRTAFGCQEKMIASVGIPSNRYLYRKVYIQTDIEHNHNMVFKIEVVEWP